MADVKGDLTGITQPGSVSAEDGRGPEGARHRGAGACGLPGDALGRVRRRQGSAGHPVRATVSDMGPLLLARMLDLNEIQAGVLQLVFKIADDNGLLLLDLKDLRAMLQHVGDNAAQFQTELRQRQRGQHRRDPARPDADRRPGRRPLLRRADARHRRLHADRAAPAAVASSGVINILAADKLLNSPRLYATFLLWMLSELFEQLPEVGDLDKPKLVFFFDEAHLLFDEAPKVLIERIELVVRLVRSKGVGVFFVTQNPLDVPDSVLAQLGNRVQHALRAFTPRDQKAVKAAASTMRANPEARHRDRDHRARRRRGAGQPARREGPAERHRARLRDPARQPDRPDHADERKALIAGSLVAGVYEKTVDRESAYEKLKARVAAAPAGDAGARHRRARRRPRRGAPHAGRPAAACSAA